jgi:hypothetical protein
MVDWTSGTNDASVEERDSGFVVVRIPGTPDVLKEAPVSGFVTKDAGGNANIAGNITLSQFYATVQFNAGGPMVYVPAASTLAFALGGFPGAPVSEVMRINPSGHFLAGTDNTQTLGGASNRWSVVFAGTGTINTSDEREKTDISEIPEAWLDAWADVEWRRFKFVDRVRWHIGLVAQQVHAAFAAHDIDAFEIGLCCYDEWEEEREPIFENVPKTRKTLTTQYVEAGVNENGQPLFIAQDVEIDEEYEESVDAGETKVTKPAGDRWGLRYGECQAIEAAYQLREMARMAARLALLEGAKS